MRKFSRAQKTQQNEYLVAKIGVDTAENGPPKVADVEEDAREQRQSLTRSPSRLGTAQPTASVFEVSNPSIMWTAKQCWERKTVRSPLYQRRFLRPNTHFAAFFEIYKIFTVSHRSKLQNVDDLLRIFAKFC